jgi:redox-sensitive bicupin YhaK (pirin superfamily)
MSVTSSTVPGVEMVILPPTRDLGDGFTVRRALPSAQRRTVGPFIFFDQMGEVVFGAGKGLDVRPHPHIGLSTLTYLLQGEILHRDSVGSVQRIQPGAVNWMTAGSGIVHSERTAPDVRAAGHTLFGVQTWLALPKAAEETAPSFIHYAAKDIPSAEADGVTVRVVAGSADGMRSPVAVFSDTLYTDVVLAAGARYAVDTEHIERALYVIAGAVEVEGQEGRFETNQLVVLKPGAEIILRAAGETRLICVGGEPLPEKRFIYWNFVSSSGERIQQAADDWQNERFAKVAGDDERIPLPHDPFVPKYP